MATGDLAVLEEAYDCIDFIFPLHRYFNYDPAKQLFTDARMKRISRFLPRSEDFLDTTIISACDFVKGKKRSDKTMMISFDEWGVITDTGAVPGGVSQDFLASPISVSWMRWYTAACCVLSSIMRIG